MRVLWAGIGAFAVIALAAGGFILSQPGVDSPPPVDSPSPSEQESSIAPQDDALASNDGPESDGSTEASQAERSTAIDDQRPSNNPRSRVPVGVNPLVPEALDTDDNRSESSDSNSETTDATAPGIPTGLSVTPGLSQASLSWSAPTSNGGAAVTDYIVEQSTDEVSWSTVSDGVSSSTSTTVTGLTNGTTYYFRVSAKNSAGTSEPTSSVSSTMVVAPGAPTGVTLTGTSRTAATLSWTAPGNTGGAAISDYVIERSTDGTSWSTVNDGVSTAVTESVTGLTTGTTYYFRVSAKNSAGTGDSASTNKEWLLVPAAPTALTITPDNDGSAELSWTAPADDGGATITDYVIEQSDDDDTWTEYSDGVTSLTSATVRGLIQGSPYYFRVKAVNSVGTGEASASKETDMVAPPGEPSNLTRSYGGDSGAKYVDLSWSAPLADGGALVSAYVIERSTDGTNWTTVSSSVTTTSYRDDSDAVKDGGTFAYRVSATNSAGTGDPVTVSLQTIPDLAA